jgi:hypothetical protein
MTAPDKGPSVQGGDIPRPGANFCVSTRVASGVTFYFIESTAPDAVDVRLDPRKWETPGLKFVDPEKAVCEIAKTLTPEGKADVDANLVVMVHGFNTPRPRVLDFYQTALEAIERDRSAIFGGDNRAVVCIGYRWPSESIWGDLRSTFDALPWFPWWGFFVALGILFLYLLGEGIAYLTGWGSNVPWGAADALIAIVWIACAVLAIVIIVAALRGIVYFRDVYRATNYGVPDLVEVIRQIDFETKKRARSLMEAGEGPRRRIALSFIGHSMGALVVTNVIRVLSDVFDRNAILKDLEGRERPRTPRQAADGRIPGKIGHVFDLTRFVLASPDIPAETLLADRANFLAASLDRFDEAYLFSSEGDEVLRMISTTVNYFSFPTNHRIFGYRLGNTEILSSTFGEIGPSSALEWLRVGARTLVQLSDELVPQEDRLPDYKPAKVAGAFTYFDCTDYVDGPDRKGYLTEALNYKAKKPTGSIPYPEHIKLLIRYALFKKPSKLYINVHGGYFDGAATQQLIYRLACLGYHGAQAAYGSSKGIEDACGEHQIRVLRSPRLDIKPESPEDMDLRDS